MDDNASITKRRQQLRWKLTLSYTGVTVAALLTVELIILGALAVILVVLLNSGFLPAQLIEIASDSFTPTLRFFLTQTPPNEESIAEWLEGVGAATSTTLPLSFDATDQMLVIGQDGRLLGARPADLLGSGQIGQPFDTQTIPELAAPIQAALAGDELVEHLYALDRTAGTVVLAVSIWDESHDQVLGVLAAIAPIPTVMSTLAEILPILGGSLLLFVLIAGVAGTAFGYLAARGPVQRLNKLSEASRAWSQGDFTVSVDDPTGDELGQLAYRLNQMARQLEHLLDTQRELAVVEERNRLARDLHDSAKQQAFAAAAQVGAARALLKQDPDTAETYMEEAERLIYELRQELTALIQELRPAALEGKGLATAVREYGALWSRQSGIRYEVRISGERTLPLAVEQTLFRIMQEALANVSRHSEASNVAIGLDYVNGHISLTVADDGRGFDINGEQTGIGLVSMRERAEVLGGTFAVESSLNKGTTVLCTIPVTASDTNGQEEAHE